MLCVWGAGGPSDGDLRPVTVSQLGKRREKKGFEAQETTGAQNTLGLFLFPPFKH